MSEVVLPEGWFTALLGDVCTKPQYGYTTRASDNGDVKFLRTTDITKNTLNWETVPFCEVNPDNVDKYRLYDRDIVISRAGSIGFSCLLKNPPDNAVFASYLIRFQPADLMNEIFLKRFLESSYYWEQLAEKAAGNAVQNVNAQKLANIELFLPPLAEQKVIADKLDSLLAQVDNIKNRLDALPTIIKRFKQSVLSAAVSGKLTEEWRGSAIYSKVDLALSKSKIQTAFAQEWQVVNLEKIAKIISGNAFKSNDFIKSGVPVIKISNIQYGEFEIKNQEYLPSEFLLMFESFSVNPADVLMALTRPITNDTLKICRYPLSAKQGLLNQRVCKFDFCNEKEKAFFELVFQSSYFKSQVEDNLSETLQPNLSPTDLKKFIVGAPSLEEQTEIVRRVEQLFAYADQIEQQVKNAQSRVNNLTQSILAKAFRGELTADWRAANPHLISGENSAQALLAKIKAEREKPKKTTKQQAMFNE